MYLKASDSYPGHQDLRRPRQHALRKQDSREKGKLEKWALHSLLLFAYKDLLILVPQRTNALRRGWQADKLSKAQQPHKASAQNTKLEFKAHRGGGLVNPGCPLYFSGCWILVKISLTPSVYSQALLLSSKLVLFSIWCKTGVNFILLEMGNQSKPASFMKQTILSLLNWNVTFVTY